MRLDWTLGLIPVFVIVDLSSNGGKEEERLLAALLAEEAR